MPRPSASAEILAVKAILDTLPSAGKVIVNPRFVDDLDSDAKIYGAWRDLVKGHGWIVLAMEQEPRERVGNETRGFDNIDAIAMLDYGATSPAPNTESFDFFGAMCAEAQSEFDKPQHETLGLGTGVIRHQFLIGAPPGPRLIGLDRGEDLHVWPHRLRIFTRGR